MYYKMTEPVIQYYEKHADLKTVKSDKDTTIEDVFEKLRKILKK